MSSVNYKELSWVFMQGKPSKGLAFSVTFMTLITTSSALSAPFIVKSIVDGFSTHNLETSGLVILLFTALTIGAAASGINYYLVGRFSSRVLVNLRSKAFEKSVSLPINYFDTHSSAEPTSIIVNDALVLHGFISRQIEPLISSVLMIVTSIAVLTYIDWMLTLFLVVTLLISICTVSIIATRITTISRKFQEKEALLLKFIVTHLSNIRLIKADCAEVKTHNTNKEILNSLFELKNQHAKAGAIISPVSRATAILALICVIVMAALRVDQGLTTLGTLIAFILCLFNLVSPITQLAGFNIAINEASGAAIRMADLMALNPEPENSAPLPIAMKASIRIRKLRFGYNTTTPVLKGVDIEFHPNQITAIVGDSGSGKSTLFSLLLKFYQPSGGGIYIADQNLMNIDTRLWRNRITHVAQNAPLVPGTIRYNLMLGINKEPNDNQISDALAYARISDYVDNLPNGLETEVGEGGTLLSGGQKQRLAIARAILRGTDYLLLDEPTSNLDRETESKFIDSIVQLKSSKTLIVSAHNLPTVMAADKIYVLSEGRVIASGTHDELINSQACYQNRFGYQSNLKQELRTAQ